MSVSLYNVCKNVKIHFDSRITCILYNMLVLQRFQIVIAVLYI